MAVENEEGYRVVFASDLNAELGPGTVLVAPADNSWNDFGFQIRVDILVRRRTSGASARRDNLIFLKGFLGFIEAHERLYDARVLGHLLAQTPDGRLASTDVPAFFTMFPEMASYRELVSALGPREARAVLVGLHDMVEADDVAIGRPWLKAAAGSRVFQKAFLRTAEAFFAWKNAGLILHGVEFERVGRISEELRIEFQMVGRPTPHRLRFRFSLHEALLPKRFAILIGKNGVGKSQSLGRIADAAIRGLDILTDGAGQRPSFNRILAFYSTTIASEVFPAHRRNRSKVWYQRFPLGGPGHGRKRQTTADLIVQLARTPERIRDESRLAIFLSAVRAIENHAELALATSDAAEPTVALSLLMRGGEQELLDRFSSINLGEDVVRNIEGRSYSLSSGELSFVRFAALASLHIENSSLLLFDEPETHLHPNFISQFVLLLDNLLEKTGSAAIIATHSVYFVREAFEDQVRVIRSAPDRSITVETPLLRTFGADVGSISYFVFGEDEPSRLAKAVEQRIAEQGTSWEAVFETYKDELSLDLLGEIRAEIEDRDGGATSE